jgi:GT2 family glycosyltransferase/glycosyltransferase involved in cell wall biosynthesis
VHICTTISRNWLAHARSLAESVREYEPTAKLSVLIVDPFDGLIDPAQEPFEVLTPADLDVPYFDAMSVRYGPMELCAGLKPSLIRYVLGQGAAEVVFLDSDIRLHAPLAPAMHGLREHAMLLTPHLLSPLAEDGHQPDDLAIIQAGEINTGVIFARADDDLDAILAWWADRLVTGCRPDAAKGMVYDQRWVCLIPGLLDRCGLCRDPGVNFGYWRVPTTELGRADEGFMAEGVPLRCMHFTGFDPNYPERLSRYDNRTLLNDWPALSDLCAHFIERLTANGHEQASAWGYGYHSTAGGIVLDPLLRELWDRGWSEGALVCTPFNAQGEAAFLRWLDQPHPTSKGAPLSRYLHALHDSRPDLAARFPDPHGRDRETYLRWAREHAASSTHAVLTKLAAGAGKARRPGLRRLAPGESIGAERGQTVVCIPVFGAADLFTECLSSALEHTEPETPIVILDDASPDPGIGAFVESLERAERFDLHEVIYVRQAHNVGFPQNVNSGFAAAAPADVVVLNSDCVVAEGWLAGLRGAAYSDELVATASALTNNGTLLSVPERNRPLPDLPQDLLLTDAAASVLTQSLRVYPRLPTAIGHCMYVRRQALDLVGNFDAAFSPGYGEEVDFSQRCLLYGLLHVAADDVFVLHYGGGSLGEDGQVSPVRKEHEKIIEARYPYYRRAQTAAGEQPAGPLPRALATARRAIEGLTATIDGRCLGPVITGTQVHTLEVIRGLSHSGRIRLRVIVPPDMHPGARDLLASLSDVEMLAHSDVHPSMKKTDIAHRPYQVSNANDLLVLDCVGERTVITHQDLIAYDNPGYFPGYPHWERYRRLTRHALALADGVVFISQHAADAALREELVDHDRVNVIYNGVNHSSLAYGIEPHAPEALTNVPHERPLLLCLGTDFLHKNRVFALRLLQALREQQGWDGILVFAGPKVSDGSSCAQETAFLALHPEMANAVVKLAAVSEAEKLWLFDRAQALLYPTTYEGFGLMPFEAAAHGLPCIFASHTALAEILPAELATLVPWDPVESAQRTIPLLIDPARASTQIRAIRAAGTNFTWEASGQMLVEAYYRTAASPTRDATRLARDLAHTEAELIESERKYNELWQSLSPDARYLVTPRGPLDPIDRRSLVAVLKRRVLRRMMLGPLRMVHRVAGKTPAAPGQTDGENFGLHFEHANLEHMREQLAQVELDHLTSDG